MAISERRFQEIVADLQDSGGPDVQYLNRIPREVRELSEARRDAQLAREIDDRHAFQKTLESLRGGASFDDLAVPFAHAQQAEMLREQTPEARRRARAAMHVAQGVMADEERAKRVEQFGTPYSYEQRQREAEGGVYRDEGDARAMLAADPETFLAELQRQKAQADYVPEMAGGGGYGRMSGGRPSDEARALRLDDLLQVAGTRAQRHGDVTQKLKADPGADVASYFNVLDTARKAAQNVGTDPVIDELEQEARTNPAKAKVNAKAIAALEKMRVVRPGDQEDPTKFLSLLKNNRRKLPADQSTLDYFTQLTTPPPEPEPPPAKDPRPFYERWFGGGR